MESEQLTLYQIGAEERLEREVASLALVHVPTDTEWAVPRRGEQEVDAVRRLVVETAEAIERGRFEPRTGAHCSWCHVRPTCPAFADEFPQNWAQQTDALLPTEVEIAELVDALGDAQARSKRLDEEIRQLRERLIAWFEETGRRAAVGSAWRVRASRAERGSLTCSDEELRELLEPEGLWEVVLAPAHRLKSELLERAGLPATIRRRLEEWSDTRVSWRLTATPAPGEDEGGEG